MVASNWLSIFDGGNIPLYLAPMAGFTDVAFRGICKKFGADVLVSEFVQSEPLIRDNARTWRDVDFTPAQRPMGIQIFGANADSMARAAALLEARMQPDFIDLNFGCPARKVVETNAGSSLLRDLPALEKIAKAVVAAVPDTVVTAKMRLGWGASTLVHRDVARILEDAGVRVVAVHGRTKNQGYSGVADWEKIAEVVQSVRIPVVGNGDIRDGETALRRVRESGVAGLMIGRGALGRPWVFAEIKAALRGGEKFSPPSENEIRAMIVDYAEQICATRVAGWESLSERERERQNVRWFVARLHGFTQTLTGRRKLRAALSACHTLGDVKKTLAPATISE